MSDFSTTNSATSDETHDNFSDVLLTSHPAHIFLEFWTGTAGSQIFIMQLGFLCYESGFVKSMWSASVILKNIEDTVVGIAIYCLFSFALIEGESLCGIIGLPNHIFLIGVDPQQHLRVFIGCVFATTCSSLISGAVLERMKNKVYITWCSLVLLFNYSFIAHWVWNSGGWLHSLGFRDDAGGVVVHSTGGTAAAIAIWQLGARRGSSTADGTLTPNELATQPNIHAIGAFLLWYGCFAFNLSSPVAHDYINPALVAHSIALITLVAPTCAACASLLLMYRGVVELRYTDILGTILAGLISITGCCYTIDLWAGALIGFFATPLYYLSSYVVRCKLHLDDPLHVISIHLTCGLYGCIMDGVFAHGIHGAEGLVYGGYKHFGIQLLGTVVCFAFNVILCLVLWFLMKKCVFKNTSLRVSILDTYLGVLMTSLDSDTALGEMLRCNSNLAKYMIMEFHKYCKDRFNDEMLDFMCVINLFRERVLYDSGVNADRELRIVSYVLKVTEAFVKMSSKNCVNVSGTVRSQIIKMYDKLVKELQERKTIKEDKLVMELKERQTSNERSISQSVSESINIASISHHHEFEMTQMSENKKLIAQTLEMNESDSLPETYLNETDSNSNPSYKLLKSRVVDDTFFDMAYNDVFYSILPVFNKFLVGFDRKQRQPKCHIKTPFELQDNWTLIWHKKLQKEDNTFSRVHTNSQM